MAKAGKDKTISIRLSQAMVEALDARAVSDEKDRTQVIREAITQYLELSEDSIEERLESLENRLEELYGDAQREKKRTDSIELRINELSHLMTIHLEQLK